MGVDSEGLRGSIPALRTAASIERLGGGYSTDEKYLVVSADGGRYLLRTAGIAEWERKRSEFRILEELRPLGVRSPRPVEVGVAEGIGICYTLLSYVEGEEARLALPGYAADAQYRVGEEAGRDLARMHALHAPDAIGGWHPRAMGKHRAYLEAYRACGVRVVGDDRIIAFVEENEGYARDRPNRFQHDDFHVGNIIASGGRYSGAIDFGRYDWGDPVHDFYKLALFSRGVSVPFCVGQVEGYFGHRGAPERFWTLYSLYAAMAFFSAVVWTLRVVPDDIGGMLERLRLIYDDHEGFERVEPRWFRRAGP